jgi:hypothetical protein
VKTYADRTILRDVALAYRRARRACEFASGDFILPRNH